MNIQETPEQFYRSAWKLLDATAYGASAPIRKIQDAACTYFNVTHLELMSYRRAAHIALARKVAAYLSCELTGRSLPEIGRLFKRDHTTILHSRNSIRAAVESDQFIETAVQEITDIIKGQDHD